MFITSISFAIYLAARLADPLLRDRRQRSRRGRRVERGKHSAHGSLEMIASHTFGLDQ